MDQRRPEWFQDRSAALIRPGLALLMVCSFAFTPVHSLAAARWVGTWACAPYAAANNTPPSPYLENNTFRQIVRCSIGGDTMRVKFSNITCSTPVTMNSVNIAVAITAGGSAIDAATLVPLTFGGSNSVTMPAYTEVTSDPVAFDLAPGANIAITIYYGQCKTASDMTHHYGSRTDSYILVGDHARSASFEGARAIERWYTLSNIDVLAPETAGAVAVLGNSITDAYGVHGGPKNKWTDFLSQQLLDNPPTSQVGVLNLGIGATLLTTSGVGRFQQDILGQNGLRFIIVFYGVNDINAGVSAATLINACKGLIAQAHAQNIRIYGSTITPFKGHSYYTAAHEAVRKEVNGWIRTPGNFDRCIDFDAVLRDPADPEKMQAAYANDFLHPNAAGYQFLGESVDLNLFMGGDTTFEQPEYYTACYEPECARVGADWEIVPDVLASNGCYVTVRAGIESTGAAPTTESGFITLPFSVASTGDFSLYGRLNCPTANDDSWWVKMDHDAFVMKNGLGTSGWEWKSLGSFSLTEGVHALTIAYREDGAKMDKLCLTNSPFSPSGLGKEAENLCDPTGVQGATRVPSGYFLGLNYPNPFNPTTQIDFNIAKTENVSLKIYDILGQEVTTLVEDQLNAGGYQVTWDGRDFSGSSVVSGTYFYRLTAGDQMIFQKMLLLR
jgi:lysophospholipase L1-like esterase